MLKMNMRDRREMILNGNIYKTILFLSIPTIMMTLVGSMIPFTDGLFLNKIIGAKRVASITYVQPAISVMLGMSQGLGVAAMAIIGQAVGIGNIAEVKRKALQIFIFSLFCGILLIPVSILVGKYMSTTVDETMSSDVFLYVSLYSAVIPFQFLAAIFNSLKNSMGNPEAPFYRMVVLLLLKIIFNYICLDRLGLGIKGAVLASFCAYAVTACWMYYDLFKKRYLYTLDLKSYKFDYEIVKELVRIGLPSMLSYMMLSLGFLLINMEMRKYGNTLLAAIGISGYINSIIFQVPSSVATTLTTVISVNIGVSNRKKARMAFWIGLGYIIIIAFISLSLVVPFLDFYTTLFTNDVEILKIANESLKIYTYSIFPFGIFAASQAVLNALGRNTIPLIMSFSRIWLFRYIFILVTEKNLGYSSFFYGNLVSNMLAGLIFFVIVIFMKWETGIKK